MLETGTRPMCLIVDIPTLIASSILADRAHFRSLVDSSAVGQGTLIQPIDEPFAVLCSLHPCQWPRFGADPYDDLAGLIFLISPS
jgi:hypothetical protein